MANLSQDYITDIPGYYYDPKTKKHFKMPPKRYIDIMPAVKSLESKEEFKAPPSTIKNLNTTSQIFKRQLGLNPLSEARWFIKSQLLSINDLPKAFIRLKSAEIFQKRTNICDLYMSPNKDYIISTSRAFGMNISEKYQRLDFGTVIDSFLDEEGFFDSQREIFPYGIDGPQTLRVVNSFSNLRFYDYEYQTPPICHKPYRFYVSSYGFEIPYNSAANVAATTTNVTQRDIGGSQNPEFQNDSHTTTPINNSEIQTPLLRDEPPRPVTRDDSNAIPPVISFENFYPAILCSDWQLNAPYVITKRLKSIDSFCINPIKPILACVYREKVHFIDLLTISNRGQCELLIEHIRGVSDDYYTSPNYIKNVFKSTIAFKNNNNNNMSIKNPKTRKSREFLASTLSDVLSMTFSNNGNTLVMGCRNGTIELIRLKTPKYQNTIRKTKQLPCLDTLKMLNYSYGSTKDSNSRSTALNQNSKAEFPTVSQNKNNNNIQQRLLTSHLHNAPIYSVCDVRFVPGDNTHLISSHYGDKLLMWDLNLSKIVLSYPGHRNNHKYIRINIDVEANILYCGCTDKTVRIWSLWDAELLKILIFPSDDFKLTRSPPTNVPVTPSSYVFLNLDQDELSNYHHNNNYASDYDSNLTEPSPSISSPSTIHDSQPAYQRANLASGGAKTTNTRFTFEDSVSSSSSSVSKNTATACCIIPPIPIYVGTPFWKLNDSAILADAFPPGAGRNISGGLGRQQHHSQHGPIRRCCPHLALGYERQRYHEYVGGHFNSSAGGSSSGFPYSPVANETNHMTVRSYDFENFTSHNIVTPSFDTRRRPTTTHPQNSPPKISCSRLNLSSPSSTTAALYTLSKRNPSFIVGFCDKLYAFY